MLLDYVMLSPTGNDTVLVKTPLPRALHGAVAAELLRRVGGEQVGYLESPADPGAAARLQMMGGEFCGNATMALGALLARRDGLADGGEIFLRLEVSGSTSPVPCHICRHGDGWTGTVSMPLPESIEEAVLNTDGGALRVPLVRIPGIAHLILPASSGLHEAELHRRLPEWHRQLGGDALGALLWDESQGFMDPLVYVPSAGTLVRERGCGSGSAAVGSLLALRAGRSMEVPVGQPGGVITARAEIEDGRLAALSITGRVLLLEEGTAEVSVNP